MFKYLTAFLFFLFSVSITSQNITGKELLEKTIQYHDPEGNWKTFKGKLNITMTTPNSSKRDSEIEIDLPNEFFSVEAKRGENTTKYTLDKGICTMSFNGNENPSAAVKKEHKLSCDRAHLFKNYYTYLYGLPMKLKDNGTIIDNNVEKRTFKGKEYLVLKATYDANVGKDTWYFYFNPKTYAMEVYQFFKATKDSGEYILLSDETTINGIKMPKVRAWYYNKNDGYLGTDTLTE
ncbi:DUF6503 family protein [Tenacibaculum jejuense]|uniref:Aspartyl-tRNA synthetase n=1 Tax=Tenacibaculum jejuense TaxID=584609 RepID=A0A238U6E2_9FLAO|nr:DUF6503 family protein [Tenacibaculum jejuense]SNR13950.1 Protein of unknown function precursor [Tenacibaculum jejuense]